MTTNSWVSLTAASPSPNGSGPPLFEGAPKVDVWQRPELAELVSVITADLEAALEERRLSGVGSLSEEDRRQRAHTRGSQWLEEAFTRAEALGQRSLSETEEAELLDAAIRRVFGTPWEAWLRPEYSDVFFNGPHESFAINRYTGEKIRLPGVAKSNQELIEQIRQVASHGGRTVREINEANPTLNLRLNDGSRLHAVLSPLTNKTMVSIRQHNPELARLDELYSSGMMSKAMLEFFKAVVASKMTVIIVGSVGAGKTTLLRALLNEVDPEERIATVEDDQEISLSSWPDLNPDVIEYEARQPNIEGIGEFTMEQCLRETLRQNPSRVVVGEIRGGEVVAFLRAISNGLSGSFCTVHADSTAAAFDRLGIYAALAKEKLQSEMVNKLIASAVDFVVHVQKGPDGHRRVTSIREVCRVGDGGSIESNEIWAPASLGDIRGVPTGIVPTDATVARLEAFGWDRKQLQRSEDWR